MVDLILDLCYHRFVADFAERLRILRTKKGWRQRDLAARLGVAQTTIANYEQGTRFPDEAVLRSVADLFETSLDYLLGRSDIAEPAVRQREPLPAKAALPEGAGRYLELVLAGRGDEAVAYVLSAAGAQDPRDIYLGILAPALEEIGSRWDAGTVDVAQEHYASGVTRSAMERLRAEFPQGHQSPRVVCVAAGIDQHDTGLRMVADFFAFDGWSVHYLGTAVPAASVVDAVARIGADLLAVSVTQPAFVDAAAAVVSAVRSRTRARVLAGGRALSECGSFRDTVGADGFARDAREAVQVGRRLVVKG
jgi:MerR family transcriptional regulator, light-induced transcriptional regulator